MSSRLLVVALLLLVLASPTALAYEPVKDTIEDLPPPPVPPIPDPVKEIIAIVTVIVGTAGQEVGRRVDDALCTNPLDLLGQCE